MTVEHILHVSLLVADTERSLTFYRDLLGLKTIKRPDLGFEGAWLGLGEQQIHLLQLDNPDPRQGRPEHVGRDRHLALGVTDLDALERRLDDRGVRSSRSRSGRAALFCRDPDGNGIELIQLSEPLPNQLPGQAAALEQARRVETLDRCGEDRVRNGFFMDEIVNAYMFNECAPHGEPQAFICVSTSTILLCDESLGGCVDERQEAHPTDDCIPLPHKNDLDLGKHLVFNFVRDLIPEDLGNVERMFSRRGAYRRFKAFLEERDILDRWYDYETSAQETALRSWCEWNQIPLKD